MGFLFFDCSSHALPAVSATAVVAAVATATAVTTATTTATAAAVSTPAAAAAAATVAATTAAAIGRARTTRTEAAAIATATTESATAAARLALNGFTNSDRTTIQQRAVHGLHGRGALIICFHLEEREATAAAGLAIHDHFRRGNGAELGEGFLQTLGRDRIGQIAHKQFTTHSRLRGWRKERAESGARLLNSFSPSVSLTIDEMTKKLTGKTLTGISRSRVFAEDSSGYSSASVAMPHLCADSAAESTRVEKRRRPSHNHFRL